MRPTTVAVVTAAVALALAGTLLAGSVLGFGARPVVLIGDSITAGAQRELTEALAGDHQVVVDGRPGYRVADQLPAARRLAVTDPDQVVVNLGTNDVNAADQDLDASLAALAEMVGLFPDAACIHLVTVNEQMVSRSVDAPGRARRFNDGLFSLAAGDPGITVVDWSTAVADWQATHPGDVITTDTVHPDARGDELLADLYAEAVSGCPRPR